MTEVAIAIGVSVASTALNVAIHYLTRPDVPKSKDEQILAKSQYGFSLRKPYGKVRLNSCNIFWALPVKKVTEDSDESGGKGGGGNASNEVTYLQNFAFEIGYEQIKRVNKIWFSKELVYSVVGGTETSEEATALEANNLEIYLGTLDQMPSPHLEQYEGIGNVHAFRKVPYIVVKNYPSKTQGFPTIDVEVLEEHNRTVGATIADVCSKVSMVAGVDFEIDVNLANKIINGTVFNQSGDTPQEFIEELQKSYFFFPRDLGLKIQFMDFATPEQESILEIPFSSLGAKEVGSDPIPLYKQTIIDERTLPSKIDFEFINPDKDYDLGSQPAFNQYTDYHNEISIRTGLVFKDSEASTIAWKLLAQMLHQSRKFSDIFLLPGAGTGLRVGQLINIPILGEDTIIQISTKEIAPNSLVEITGVLYEKITPNHPPDTTYYPTVNTPKTGSSVLAEVIAMDTHLIKDSDNDYGLYLGIKNNTGSWNEGAIFASDDGGQTYDKVINFSGVSTTGKVTQIPNTTTDTYPLIQEDGEVTILLDIDKPINSISEHNFLNRRNLALFGSEYIAWQNAELIAPLTYKLTRLIRGLRGTEWAINQHSLNERFFLFDGAGAKYIRSSGEATDLNKTLTFKAVHSGQTLDFVSITTSITVVGNALKPYSPVNITATKDNVGNITLTWSRRDRHAGYDTTYSNLPLSELSEQWEVEVLNGNVVKRLLTTITISSTIYTNQQQIVDFSSLQDIITVRIYQISATVGRGYPATATLTPDIFQPLPEATKIEPDIVELGDTVDIYGSGFNQLTGVSLNGIAASNFIYHDDTHISAIFNDPLTQSGHLQLEMTANTLDTELYLTIIDTQGSGFTGFVIVTSSRTIEDDDFGKLLLCMTNSGNITLTLDKSLLSTPENFTFSAQKSQENNSVLFVGAANNNLVANGFELEYYYDTASWFCNNSNNNWYGVGALGVETFPDLSGFITSTQLTTTLANYALKSELPNLSNYVTNSSLTTILTDYVTFDDLPTQQDLSNYVTNTSLTNTLGNYALISQLPDLSNYVTFDDLPENQDLSNYVTNTSLTNTLSSYALISQLPDLTNYVTFSDLPDFNLYITQALLDTTLQDYVTFDDLTNNTGSGSGFTGFVIVTSSRTINDSDLGKILICNTNAGNITLTLNASTLTSPNNFNFTAQKAEANNKVIFAGSGLIAKATELESQYDAASWFCNGTQWRGYGALGQINLASYALLTDIPSTTNFMLKGDYVNSDNLIKQSAIAYPAYSGSNTALPYTLQISDIGREIVVSGTGNLRIPDAATGFVNGWGCVVSFSGTPNVTITRASGGTSGLVFSGGYNSVKTQGAIAITHRGSNVWLIVGGLEA